MIDNPSFSTATSSTNEAHFTSRVKYKPEVIYMITEGRAEHIDAIANEIERYEKWESKWDIVKILMSICSTITLFGWGILIPDYFTEAKIISSSLTGKILEILSSSCTIVAIISLISIYVHSKDSKERYNFQAQRLKDIMKKVRQSIETL